MMMMMAAAMMVVLMVMVAPWVGQVVVEGGRLMSVAQQQCGVYEPNMGATYSFTDLIR